MSTADIIDLSLVFCLVILTGYYTWLTRKTVVELERQRFIGVLPVLLPTSLHINDRHAQGGHTSCIVCNLKNIGNALALKIHVGLYDPETDKQIATSHNFIDYLTKESETDDNHIHIENQKLNNLKYKEGPHGEMTARIKVLLHYDDIYGKAHFSERLFTYKKGANDFIPAVGTFSQKSNTIEKVSSRFPRERLPEQ